MKKININYIEDLELLRYLINTEEYYISLEKSLDFENENSYKFSENYFKFLESKKSKGFNPIDMQNKEFIFNGNNNSINNLFISRPGEDNVGLFRNVNNSIIKNLNIGSAYVEGRIKVGALAGTMEGKISNVSISGSIEGKMIIGGLVGESNTKIIFRDNKVYNSIVGSGFIGGLLGKGEESIFINNEIDNNILYNQIYSRVTVNEYSGYSSYNLIEEKDYRKRPFISYKGLGGFLLKK